MKVLVSTIIISTLMVLPASCDRQQLAEEVPGQTSSPVTEDPPVADRAIYIFIGGSHNGNFASGYDSGRQGIDTRCADALNAVYSFLSPVAISGMISFKNDSLRNLVATDHADTKVYGITASAVKTQLADSWTDLLDEGPLVNLGTALELSDSWWTGSDIMGNTAADRCDSTLDDGNGWDVNLPEPPPYEGIVGSTTGLAGEWVSSSSVNCSSSRFFLCVAY